MSDGDRLHGVPLPQDLEAALRRFWATQRPFEVRTWTWGADAATTQPYYHRNMGRFLVVYHEDLAAGGGAERVRLHVPAEHPHGLPLQLDQVVQVPYPSFRLVCTEVGEFASETLAVLTGVADVVPGLERPRVARVAADIADLTGVAEGDAVPLGVTAGGKLATIPGEYGDVLYATSAIGAGTAVSLDTILAANPVIYHLEVECTGANPVYVAHQGAAAGFGQDVAAAAVRVFALPAGCLAADLQISAGAGLASAVDVFVNFAASTHKERF